MWAIIHRYPQTQFTNKYVQSLLKIYRRIDKQIQKSWFRCLVTPIEEGPGVPRWAIIHRPLHAARCVKPYLGNFAHIRNDIICCSFAWLRFFREGTKHGTYIWDEDLDKGCVRYPWRLLKFYLRMSSFCKGCLLSFSKNDNHPAQIHFENVLAYNLALRVGNMNTFLQRSPSAPSY